MGCARDIVEHAGVARFYWSDFPLGHSAGKPHDRTSQEATLRGALELFDTATVPRITQVSPQKWSTDDTWQQDFMDTSAFTAEHLAKMKAEHELARAVKKR